MSKKEDWAKRKRAISCFLIRTSFDNLPKEVLTPTGMNPGPKRKGTYVASLTHGATAATGIVSQKRGRLNAVILDVRGKKGKDLGERRGGGRMENDKTPQVL